MPRASYPAEQSSLLQALQDSALLLTSKTSPEGFPGAGDISVTISFCFSHLNHLERWQVHYSETTLQLSASSCWDTPRGAAQHRMPSKSQHLLSFPGHSKAPGKLTFCTNYLHLRLYTLLQCEQLVCFDL